MFKVLVIGLLVCVSAWAEKPVSMRDPTTPLGYQATVAARTQLKLQAVYTSSGRNEAIVNGLKVRVGDVIAGATILKIEDKRVTYRRDGRLAVLQLRPSIY